jgi:hypothetical protein
MLNHRLVIINERSHSIVLNPNVKASVYQLLMGPS